MLICALLLLATYFDLRLREVPAWLTLTTLLGSGVFAIMRGFWIPTLLTVALCLVAEMTIPAQRRSFAIVLSAFAAIFEPASAILCLTLFTIWFLWDLDKMGGADMKLMAAVILAFGNPIVLLPITLIGGLQGLVAYFRKQTSVPYVFSIFLGTLLYTVVPLILK
jgi:Flp pilus assembly protein protease CpaA